MKPSKLNEVQSTMDTLLYKVTKSKDITSPSIAYTTTRANTLCGTIYRIFVNNTDKELTDFLYLHECGHIIFAHARGMDARNDKFLRAKIMAAFSKVSNLFSNFTRDMELFQNALFNIVMDFEVNSRLFTQEEWEFMNERVCALLNSPGSKGMWPQDFNFPPGLTWNEYLHLILMEPEKFMSEIKQMIRHRIQHNGATQKTFLSQEEYEEHIRKMKDEKFSPEEMEELSKIADEHNKGTFSVPNGLMNSQSSENSNSIKIQFEKYSDYSQLLKKIIRELRIKIDVHTKRDLLYNSNRNKLNTNVIIPKEVRERKNTVTKRLFLLIDVSGSVDAKMVYNFISTFKTFKNNFKNVRIITWNTYLVSEWNIDEPIVNNYGGGTYLASGINYIAKKYKLSHRDTLFVISDFVDYLYDWEEELKKLSCQKYAINWNTIPNKFNPGFKKIFLKDKNLVD